MSKKSKEKINLKSAILILLLLAMLLLSSTYAWFTANKTVTVSDIDVHIEAQNGLQISSNGVDWKSMLTLEDLEEDAYAGNTNQIPDTLEPVSTIGDVETGVMKMFYGEVDPVDGVYSLTATAEPAEADGKTGRYVAFDVFLKVNRDEENVILGANSAVLFKGSDSATNKGLQNAARVAFLKQGNSEATAEVSEFIAQKGALSFTTLSQTTTFIWEPNSDVHTAAGVKAAYDTYRITTQETGAAKIPYFGIKQAITSPIALSKTNGEDTTNFTSITPSYSTPETMVDYNNAFSLSKGVTKVRIYMWVEGQDVDCENTASGSDITFKLELKVPSDED